MWTHTLSEGVWTCKVDTTTSAITIKHNNDAADADCRCHISTMVVVVVVEDCMVVCLFVYLIDTWNGNLLAYVMNCGKT